MPWFRVDDGFWSHPKVVELSPEAVALWVRGGSYAAQHLTNGKITAGAMRMLGGAREAADELVLAGLWVQDGTSAWVFHDWATYQPTKEQVEADREKAREKKRAQRARGAAKSKRGEDGRYTSPEDSLKDATAKSRKKAEPAPVLSPFCDEHPTGTTKRCRACGTARMAYEITEKSKRTPVPFTVLPGQICEDGKHTLLADGTCTRCEYRGEEAS